MNKRGATAKRGGRTGAHRAGDCIKFRFNRGNWRPVVQGIRAIPLLVEVGASKFSGRFIRGSDSSERRTCTRDRLLGRIRIMELHAGRRHARELVMQFPAPLVALATLYRCPSRIAIESVGIIAGEKIWSGMHLRRHRGATEKNNSRRVLRVVSALDALLSFSSGNALRARRAVAGLIAYVLFGGSRIRGS